MKNLLIITAALICFLSVSLTHAEPLADSVTLKSIPVGAIIVIKKIGTNDFCTDNSLAISFQESKRGGDVRESVKHGEIYLSDGVTNATCLLKNLSANRTIRLQIVSVSKDIRVGSFSLPGGGSFGSGISTPYYYQMVTFKVTNHPLIDEIIFNTGWRDRDGQNGEPIDLTVGDMRKLSQGMMDIELPGGNK